MADGSTERNGWSDARHRWASVRLRPPVRPAPEPAGTMLPRAHRSLPAYRSRSRDDRSGRGDGGMTARTRPIVVAGLPRSGTTWALTALGTSPGCRAVPEPDNEDNVPSSIHAKHTLGRYPVLGPGDPAAAYRRLWEWVFAGAYETRRVRAGPPYPRSGEPDADLRGDPGPRRPDGRRPVPEPPERETARRPTGGWAGHRQVDPPPTGPRLAGLGVRRGRPGTPAPSGQRPGQLVRAEPQGLPQFDAGDQAGDPARATSNRGVSPSPGPTPSSGCVGGSDS